MVAQYVVSQSYVRDIYGMVKHYEVPGSANAGQPCYLHLLSKVQFTSRTFEILSALKSIKGFPPPPRSHMILFPRCACAARDVSITKRNAR